jgi:hypothetical protein
MAAGDVTHIKILGKFTIPGGGSTLTGVAKNNKVMIWGELEGEYDAAGNGINLTPRGGAATAFGLETLDHLSLTVKTSNAVDAAATVLQSAQLAVDADNVFVSIDDAEGTEPTDSHAVIISFFAIGDSAATVESV